MFSESLLESLVSGGSIFLFKKVKLSTDRSKKNIIFFFSVFSSFISLNISLWIDLSTGQREKEVFSSDYFGEYCNVREERGTWQKKKSVLWCI